MNSRVAAAAEGLDVRVTTQGLSQVHYLGDAFYAVGGGATILRSPDGTTWTKVHEATEAFPPVWTGIARCGDHWIAVGGSGRGVESANGTDWTPLDGLPAATLHAEVINPGQTAFLAQEHGGFPLEAVGGDAAIRSAVN